MKQVTIEGKCWVSYKRVINMPDAEADEFMQECSEDMDVAYCQIERDDVDDIVCVEDGTVSCRET